MSKQIFDVNEAKKTLAEGYAMETRGETLRGQGQQLEVYAILRFIDEASPRFPDNPDRELTTAHLHALFLHKTKQTIPQKLSNIPIDDDMAREIRAAIVKLLLDEPIVADPKAMTMQEHRNVETFKRRQTMLKRAINDAGALLAKGYDYDNFDTKKKFFAVGSRDLLPKGASFVSSSVADNEYLLDNKHSFVIVRKSGTTEKTTNIRCNWAQFMSATKPASSAPDRKITLLQFISYVSEMDKLKSMRISDDNFNNLQLLHAKLSEVIEAQNKIRENEGNEHDDDDAEAA